MSDREVTRIRVGKFSVGIIGLREVLEETASEHAGKSDKDIQNFLLERLSKTNYIPASAKQEYANAFLREFKKLVGEPYEEESAGEVEIKVLGPGCPECEQLERTIMGLLSELHLPASIEHVRDMKEIAKYRVMATPALVINGKVRAKGRIPSKDQIKAWVIEAASAAGVKEGRP